MRAAVAAWAALLALAAAPGAGAATTEVGANGNVFTGGLSFTPANVRVAIGDSVRWRNTDNVVPHTATEKHGLWDLGGDYGQTPANPPGFAPGATVQRSFEAGTHAYYCRVHPKDMQGTVQVAPTLATQRVRVRIRKKKRVGRKSEAARKKKRRKHRRKRRRTKVIRYVVAVWATSSPAGNLAFDVQRRRVGGPWLTLRSGTRETNARFRTRKGTPWQVRARLRSASDASKATGWSPAASITG